MSTTRRLPRNIALLSGGAIVGCILALGVYIGGEDIPFLLSIVTLLPFLLAVLTGMGKTATA